MPFSMEHTVQTDDYHEHHPPTCNVWASLSISKDVDAFCRNVLLVGYALERTDAFPQVACTKQERRRRGNKQTTAQPRAWNLKGKAMINPAWCRIDFFGSMQRRNSLGRTRDKGLTAELQAESVFVRAVRSSASRTSKTFLYAASSHNANPKSTVCSTRLMRWMYVVHGFDSKAACRYECGTGWSLTTADHWSAVVPWHDDAIIHAPLPSAIIALQNREIPRGRRQETRARKSAHVVEAQSRCTAW